MYFNWKDYWQICVQSKEVNMLVIDVMIGRRSVTHNIKELHKLHG